MRALSIRQPYAELILRGLKTIEYRSRPTRIIGERFYIYAAGKTWRPPPPESPEPEPEPSAVSDQRAGRRKVWSRDLAMPGKGPAEPAPPPGWMLELARLLILCKPGEELPAGVIVGSAVIERCVEVTGHKSEISLTADRRPLTSVYEWHLTDVERAKRLRKPRGHPQPVWFEPFGA